MQLAVHTNAFRDKGYTDACTDIEWNWPGMLIEASTCREHLYKNLLDDDKFERLISRPHSNIGVISGGWCDFVRHVGIEPGGILDKQVRLALAWDVPLRIFFTNPYSDLFFTRRRLNDAIEQIHEYAFRWKGCHNLKILIENHGDFTDIPSNMNYILSEANKHSDIPIYTVLDPINYAECGADPLEATKAINPDYIYHVHAKDRHEENYELCTPGDGMYRYEWPGIITYLKDIGYNRLVTLEYEGKDMENRIKYITDGLEFLRRFIDA